VGSILYRFDRAGCGACWALLIWARPQTRGPVGEETGSPLFRGLPARIFAALVPHRRTSTRSLIFWPLRQGDPGAAASAPTWPDRYRAADRPRARRVGCSGPGPLARRRPGPGVRLGQRQRAPCPSSNGSDPKKTGWVHDPGYKRKPVSTINLLSDPALGGRFRQKQLSLPKAHRAGISCRAAFVHHRNKLTRGFIRVFAKRRANSCGSSTGRRGPRPSPGLQADRTVRPNGGRSKIEPRPP